MKGGTFERPPPHIKPPQWPFVHVVVEAVCGWREDRCGQCGSENLWAVGREEQQGSGGTTREGATIAGDEIKEGRRK